MSELRRVQSVLRWAWDPIGLRGIPEAFDEYHMYAPTVLGMLERGALEQEIADYLTSVQRDRMELPPTPEKNEDVAALLRDLHAINS